MPISNVKELVAYAKANPGKLSYASSGPGTISQQEMEIFKQAAGLDIVEVGYKSTGQAMTDAVGGQIPLFPAVVPLVLPHIKSGRVRALGLFDTRRSPLVPDVPLMARSSVCPATRQPPCGTASWRPPDPPEDAVKTLNGLFSWRNASAEVKERLGGMGAEPNRPTNEQFTAELKAEAREGCEARQDARHRRNETSGKVCGRIRGGRASRGLTASACAVLPYKAIRAIVNSAPAGLTDVVGRLMMTRMSQSLGQPS